MNIVVGEYTGIKAVTIPPHYNEREQYNVLQDILTTRHTWQFLDENTRSYIFIMLPHWINIYMKFNPNLVKADVERQLYKWITCSIV